MSAFLLPFFNCHNLLIKALANFVFVQAFKESKVTPFFTMIWHSAHMSHLWILAFCNGRSLGGGWIDPSLVRERVVRSRFKRFKSFPSSNKRITFRVGPETGESGPLLDHVPSAWSTARAGGVGSTCHPATFPNTKGKLWRWPKHSSSPRSLQW